MFFNPKLKYDILNLRRKIYSPNDKILFDEAVKCLSKKAYRASYIMIWIAAAESLRSKISELALKDSAAGKVLGEIQQLEQQNFSQDKIILDKSEFLGLVTKDEHKKLEYIRDMRNAYAHPNGVGPELKELEVAFHNVCAYILIRPAQLKHGYVTTLINSVFNNRHFLDDDDIKINEYAIEIAHRIHPEVAPYLVKKFCEAYENCTENLIKRRAVHFTQSLLRELKPKLDTANWPTVTILDQHPRAASLFFGIPEIWGILPIQAQDMCFGHLVEPTRKDGTVISPTPLRIRQVKTLERTGYLNDKQKSKLHEVLDTAPYESLAAAGCKLTDSIQRIINDLKSHNWYTQNPAIDAVSNLGLASISELTNTEQENLGRNILQSAEGGSDSARSFVVTKLKGQQLPKSFILGLLKECFTNEKFEFRIKKEIFNHILEVVLLQSYFLPVIGDVIKDINSSTPSFPFRNEKLDATIKILEDMIPSMEKEKQNALKELKNALLKIEPKLSDMPPF